MQMSRKKLNSYRKLQQEIPLLEYELNEMWMTDKGMGNSVILNGERGTRKPETVVGFDQKKYNQRKEALQRKKGEAKEVRDWIESIEDGQTRCVFKMFYVDGMNWKKIARRIGMPQNPDYPRLMIRDAYLKKKRIK